MPEPSLATLVRTWRERAFLTQEQLARSTGLGTRTIRRLESDGLRRPRTDSLRLLSDALKLNDKERAALIAAARDGSPVDTVTVPRQLPADVAGFAGRTTYLRELDALLDGTVSAVVISAIAGTAGVGKTALAVHWAHRVAERFPDGQLYVNLRGFDPSGTPVGPAAALRGFLDTLEVAPHRVPADLDAQAALYRSLLAGRRMLVVLDNARDAEQVRPLLPGAPGCLAVVTSRNQLTGLVAAVGARPLALDLLSTVEARELLAARLGTGPVSAAPEAVDELIAACAALPLALTIVAARATTRPGPAPDTLARVAAELRAARPLDALDTGDPMTNLRAVYSWSYRSLSTASARLFRLLGLHPGPDLAPPAAASLAGQPPAGVRPLLAELTDANLVAEQTPGRYAFHDLLRAYATELGQADAEGPAATRRVLDHYLHTGYAAARLLLPRDPITIAPPAAGVTPECPTTHDEALAWFSAERRTLLASIEHAAGTGWDTHAWQLTWTLTDFLTRRGHWHDYTAAENLALAAARRLADTAAQARIHRGAAHAYTQMHRFDDAEVHVRHALDLAVAAGDQVGRAHAHTNLSMLRARQDRHAEAIEDARQAVDLCRDAGYRHGQAVALSMVGWIHSQLGDHEPALTFGEQALALHRELDNRNGEAATLDSLGYAHHHLGHFNRAVDYYRQALDMHQALGDRYDETETLDHLGDTHEAAGRAGAAHDAWRAALSILDELGHPDADRVRAKLPPRDRRVRGRR